MTANDLLAKRGHIARLSKDAHLTEANAIALLGAGWRAERDEFGVAWYATPGKAPGGPWCTDTALRMQSQGDAFRALHALGWNVPNEYVGHANVFTCGQYVLHHVKAPKFIRLNRALQIEGMPLVSKRWLA